MARESAGNGPEVGLAAESILAELQVGTDDATRSPKKTANWSISQIRNNVSGEFVFDAARVQHGSGS
jgi:hypothetical protein